MESSANFRDWSIRYHSRDRTFAVNERNSSNKLLNEIVEETTKNSNIFQIVGTDRMDQMGQMKQRNVVRFLRLKASRKRPCITSLLWCSRRMPSRTWVWRDSILRGDYFGPEFGRYLICHHRPRRWSGWSERSYSAGFVRWALSFCTLCAADSPQDMLSKKLYNLYIVGMSILCILHSDIFTGFHRGSPTVRRQVKSSQVELSIQLCDLLLSIRHYGWEYILHGSTLDESWHGPTYRQIRSWDDHGF
jgi:hypothetical protein